MTTDAKLKSTINLLKSIGNDPSFDIGEFIDRISVKEDWAKLIVAHIYLDHIITSVLDEHLDHPDSYLKGHRPFSEKLVLCQALGYFRDEFGAVLTAVNTVRNKFAHKLVFDVSDEVKRNLFRTLTTERPISEATKPEGFEEFLFTVVMFAEFNRANEKRKNRLSKEETLLKQRLYELVRGEVTTVRNE